jgi:hypothetical protein
MERRQDTRYPFVCDVEPLLPKARKPDRKEPEPETIWGTVANISLGGACVIADRPTEQGGVLALRLRIKSVPVSVPVLVQVRWTHQLASQGTTFRVGLLFLC